MPPIALTDAQLSAVFEAARPLAVRDRDAFLQAVAEALQGHAVPSRPRGEHRHRRHPATRLCALIGDRRIVEPT
jgi:hypothetical protein